MGYINCRFHPPSYPLHALDLSFIANVLPSWSREYPIPRSFEVNRLTSLWRRTLGNERGVFRPAPNNHFIYPQLMWIFLCAAGIQRTAPSAMCLWRGFYRLGFWVSNILDRVLKDPLKNQYETGVLRTIAMSSESLVVFTPWTIRYEFQYVL